MADKYLNYEGLTRVASYVNEKLKTVTTMPLDPELEDVVLYKGVDTADYKQGTIYMYLQIGTYYAWSNPDEGILYTKSDAPEVGDTTYVDVEGTEGANTIEAFDSDLNEVTINSLVYTRLTSEDTPELDWVAKSNTSVILNGVDKTGDEANFYAPTVAGREGHILVSNGENKAPSWSSFSGYAPTVIQDELCFTYGILPTVQDTSMIFNIQ